MRVKMKFSKITKNHLADPEIGFYVCVRLFLKEKKSVGMGIELTRHGTRAKTPNHLAISARTPV